MEFAILVLVAALCEFVDSGLGMMYGTILSPLLIIFGYSPQDVVPAILFSQAIGGLIATLGHNRHKNADFAVGSTDFKIASVIYFLGVAAVFAGVFVGVRIPKQWLQVYIGILVAAMGLLVILRRNFRFSWRKVAAIGILSAFNKALSGGGYGPLVASGLIISGREGRNAIGTTDFAEAPICITAFFLWAVLKQQYPALDLLAPLTVGAMIGGTLGPYALSKAQANQRVTSAVGWLALVLGVACAGNVLKP